MNGQRYVYKVILCFFLIIIIFNQSVFSKNRGIINPGGACPIISALQCLSHIKCLNDFFDRHVNDFKKDSMAWLFAYTLQKLKEPNPRPIEIASDRNLEALFEMLKDLRNGDAMLAVSRLLDSMKVKESILLKQDPIIKEVNNLFYETVDSLMTCSVCGKKTPLNSYCAVAVHYVKGVSSFEEQLANSSYQFFVADRECDNCKQRGVIIDPGITYEPPVISVRYVGTPSQVPLEHLTFKDRLYTLKSFTVNTGGHWASYGRAFDGHWYFYNDDYVSEGNVDITVANIAAGRGGQYSGVEFFYEDESFSLASDSSVRVPDLVAKKIAPEKIKLVQLKDSLLRLKEKLGILSGKLRDLKKPEILVIARKIKTSK